MYSDLVKDHFKNPRNVGEIPDANGIGEVGNPVCGDMMTMYIKVDDDEVINDIKFKTFGCGAAIAVSSMVTELAKGKNIAEAGKIKNMDVAEALGGLPKNKLHCSNLGADALKLAIQDYRDRKAGKPRKPKEPDLIPFLAEEKHDPCTCPYCDIEVDEDDKFCRNCGQEIEREEH